VHVLVEVSHAIPTGQAIEESLDIAWSMLASAASVWRASMPPSAVLFGSVSTVPPQPEESKANAPRAGARRVIQVIPNGRRGGVARQDAVGFR
jgi:hypothetical protein